MIVTKEYVEKNIENFEQELQSLADELVSITRPFDEQKETRKRQIYAKRQGVRRKKERWEQRLTKMNEENLEEMPFIEYNSEQRRLDGIKGGAIGGRAKGAQVKPRVAYPRIRPKATREEINMRRREKYQQKKSMLLNNDEKNEMETI